MIGRNAWVASLALLLFIGSCVARQAGPPAKVEPAKVAHHVEESELNTIQLTDAAVQRLGIQLEEVRWADVTRQRTLGGEVVIPPGQTIVVSAPVAGTLSSPDQDGPPLAGSVVAAGQTIFGFTPLLTPEREVLTPAERVRVAQTRADVAAAQVEAERQIESAKVTVDAAQIALDRAVQLLEDKAGSQRSVDEARATLQLAREAQTTAEARYRLLADIELDEQPGQLARRSIPSPIAGVLHSVDAAPGETVAAGEPLFCVIQTERIWIRVPVYVGYLRMVDTSLPAAIREFGAAPSAPSCNANYVAAPPSANPNAITVDLFYELSNEDQRFYPGQKLEAILPLRESERARVVPVKTILYDVLGGTWVYQQTADRTFARQRVSVQFVDGDRAVLASGPPLGSLVVTDGAAELFGTEFGVGH
jgi:RND family efflux transporter MFP subunit